MRKSGVALIVLPFLLSAVVARPQGVPGAARQGGATPAPAPRPLPVRADLPVFPLLSGLHGPWTVELFDEKLVRVPAGLRQRLLQAPTQPLEPGRGSSVVTKVASGEVLAELLLPLGLKRAETLFLTSFGPVADSFDAAAAPGARSRVWRLPIAELPRLLVLFYQPEEGGEPIIANVLLDASSLVRGSWSQYLWAGLAWAGVASPFTGERMVNLDFHPGTALFADREVVWLPVGGQVASQPQSGAPAGAGGALRWEEAALTGSTRLVRATAPDGQLVGLYLQRAPELWAIYDFRGAPASGEPGPDPDPGVIGLQEGWTFLLQVGEACSPLAHLILLDRDGRPVEVPLRWGVDVSTGE